MLTVGLVVSTTVIVPETLAGLPAASVAEHDTVVEPSGNVAPEAAPHVTATTPSTMSVAVGVTKDTAAPLGPVASTVAEGNAVMAGPVVSTTITSKTVSFVRPTSSVAVQVTLVEPRANCEPEAGRHATSTLAS